MTGFTLAYAVMRVCGGQPRKNPGAPCDGTEKQPTVVTPLTPLTPGYASEGLFLRTHIPTAITHLFSESRPRASERRRRLKI